MRQHYVIIGAVCILGAGLLVAVGSPDPSAEALVEKARILASGRRLVEAESTLRRAVRLSPRYAPAHLQLSQILLQQHAFIKALNSYHNALSADPALIFSSDFTDYVSVAADVEKRQAFLKACVQLAREAPADDNQPAYVAALDLAGHVEFRQRTLALQRAGAGLAKLTGRRGSMVIRDVVEGRLDAAIAMLRQRADTSEVAKDLAAQLAEARGHGEAARSLFESAMKKDGRFPATRLGLAILHINTGAPERGTRGVLRVIEELEDPPTALLLRGARLLVRQGRIGDAEKFVRKVCEKEPGNIHARRLQAAIFFSNGRLDKLAPLVDDFKRNNPGDRRVMFLEGSIALLEERFNQATHYLSLAAGGRGGWELLKYHLALAQFRVGAANQAGQSLQELCEWRDVFPEARLARAAVALSRGRLEVAEKSCRRILKDNPDDPDALRLLAGVHISRRDVDGAIETLTRYLEVEPRSALGIEALAAARIAKGDVEAVIAQHRTPAENGASKDVHHRVLAFAYSLIGRQALAEEQYESLRPADPTLPHRRLLRARSLVLRGRIHAAADECRKGIRQGASPPAILATLGVLDTMLARHYEARRELAVGPNDFAQSTFIINVYFALARHESYAAAAAEILTADPFSTRSQDLLITVCSANLFGADLRRSLEAIADEQPGLLAVLNKAVVLRRQEATEASRLRLIDVDSMWPRLREVYRRHPIDWL